MCFVNKRKIIKKKKCTKWDDWNKVKRTRHQCGLYLIYVYNVFGTLINGNLISYS